MSARHLLALWAAETRKLLSRLLGRVGLGVAVLLGLLGPLYVRAIHGMQGEVNGTPLAELIDVSGAAGVQWSLTFRNLVVMRLFLVALVAVSVAGEYQARSLREDLLQPIPRWSALLARWAAQATWLAIGAALSWLTAMALGAVLFGTGGPWRDAAIAWAVTVLCDTGFAAVSIAVAVLVRSQVGTLIGMVLFLLGDQALGAALWLAENIGRMAELPAAVEIAVQARPWLPSSAFGAWHAWNGGDPWAWQHFAALALYTALGLGVAVIRFERMDVP